MNTQSNAMPESPLESQAIAPAVISATRPLYWSVRRELWENRSIYIAPLAVAALYSVRLPDQPRFGCRARCVPLALDPMQQHDRARRSRTTSPRS